MRNTRRLAIGDIHGNFQALQSALENALYDPKQDFLYFLGDYVDRHLYSFEVVEFLINVENKVCIRGNHDQYLLNHFAQSGPLRPIADQWKRNGGLQTLESYEIEISSPGSNTLFTSGEIPEQHMRFFESTVDFHITDDKLALVHGGFHLYLEDMSRDYVMWDRSMWKTAIKEEFADKPHYPCFSEYPKIFIGHTNLLDNPEQEICPPRKCLNVWNIDTGAGYSGPLTVMDMDTEEYWQS